MNEELMRIARRRVAARIGLYVHATVYVLVNAFLVLLHQRTTPELAWSVFPLAGWGLGLAIHAAVVLLSGSGLRERMEAEELRRLEQRRPQV